MDHINTGVARSGGTMLHLLLNHHFWEPDHSYRNAIPKSQPLRDLGVDIPGSPVRLMRTSHGCAQQIILVVFLHAVVHRQPMRMVWWAAGTGTWFQPTTIVEWPASHGEFGQPMTRQLSTKPQSGAGAHPTGLLLLNSPKHAVHLSVYTTTASCGSLVNIQQPWPWSSCWDMLEQPAWLCFKHNQHPPSPKLQTATVEAEWCPQSTRWSRCIVIKAWIITGKNAVCLAMVRRTFISTSHWKKCLQQQKLSSGQ